MATARRTHLTTDYIRSPFISERRRKLFPAEDQDMDSDLGLISPIVTDEPCDLGVKSVQGNETPLGHRACSDTMSPLKLSPYTGKFSPSQNLKTPHDTSTKPVLEKDQKVLVEESKSLKRKTSPGNSHQIDSKSSKVRTALFPPESALDVSLSTKCFYSKKQENVVEQVILQRKRNYKPISLAVNKHGTRRGIRRGQINNGVKHKIRKPKQKKVNTKGLIKTTKKMLETGSALSEYILDLSELKNKQLEKLQTNKKLIYSPPKSINQAMEDKENNLKPLNVSPPTSPEDKRTRKFFKSSRSKSSTKPLKTMTKESLQSPCLVLFDNPFDEEEEDAEPAPTTDIDQILSSLSGETVSPEKQHPQVTFPTEATKTPTNPTKIMLEAHHSVTASENSIHLHQQPTVANTLLSPISQMCNVTSGLVLNSPRKGRDVPAQFSNVSKMLSFNGDCPSSVDMEEQRRLFPIFCKGAAAQAQARGEKRERVDVIKRSVKRFKALPPDQTLLDAGQKKFGYTLCNECNIVYHMGDPNDEIQHSHYHDAHHVLRFAGWKNEHIVADFPGRGRIIRVLPTDSKAWLKKVKELMGIVIRDLGCYEMEYDISQSQVYLYIKNRTIAGCAVATIPKENGHRMLSSLSGVAMCSEESYPIKCGISHLWVAANHRKQGVASALIDAVKNTFIPGTLLSNGDVALTSPTEAGSAFAEKYFRTSNYLIYYT